MQSPQTRPFLPFLLFVACATNTSSETVREAVIARLNADSRSKSITIFEGTSCEQLPESATSLPVGEAFRQQYPEGVYFLCDERVSSNNATATILRWLYHAATDQVVVSEEVEASLRRSGRLWRVTGWNRRTVGYAPPAAALPNSTQQLSRPGFGPAAELP